ncbi:MAG: DUF948 domain-containing protein [candidate division Zixibacteria bacterium]|nr:DUF948 domain-containing protein [candidate division Zixibacteria bacterium]
MSDALQVALFLASISIVALCIFTIVTLFAVKKLVERVVNIIDGLKAPIESLIESSQDLIADVKELSGRAKQQWYQVEHIMHTARGWSDQGNRIVSKVGSIVEVPIDTATRLLNIVRGGLTMFVQSIFNRTQNHQPKVEVHDAI